MENHQPLYEIDQSNEDIIIRTAIDLKEIGYSFAEIMKELQLKFGNTYDRKRIATMVKEL